MKNNTYCNTAKAILARLAYQPETIIEVLAAGVKPEMFPYQFQEIAASVFLRCESDSPMPLDEYRDRAAAIPLLATNPLSDVADNLPASCAFLFEQYRQKRVKEILHKAVTQDTDDSQLTIDYVTTAIEALETQLQEDEIGDAMAAAEGLIEFYAQNEYGKILGARTGFATIDTYKSGWQSSEFAIIGAHPGMGKTTFLCHTLIQSLQDGRPVCFFSLGDMAARDLYFKVACIIAKVNPDDYKKGRRAPTDAIRLSDAIQEIKGMPLYIYSGLPTNSVSDITSRVLQVAHKHGTKDLLCLVDYIQQVKPSNAGKAGDKMYQVMNASSELNAFCKRHPITMICASQLKSDAVGRRPITSDLQWASALQQDADFVGFSHRNDDDGVVEFICTKDRAGARVPTIIDLVYDTQTATLVTKQEAEDKAAFGGQQQSKVITLPPVKAYARAEGDDLPF